MATYQEIEESEQESAPVFYYIFTGASDTWQFTSQVDDDVSGPLDSIVYQAIPISHSEVRESEDISKASLTVTLPADLPFCEQFQGWMPEVPVAMTLYRGQASLNQLDKIVLWVGRVTTAKRKDSKMILSIENFQSSLTKSGNTARIQVTCRHVLYSQFCGVQSSGDIGTITARDGFDLTIPGAGNNGDNWYAGGYIQLPDGSRRGITRQIGDTVTINRPSRYLFDNEPPISISAWPGCDKTLNTCNTKFSNHANFGGFPFMPGRNPFGGISIV